MKGDGNWERGISRVLLAQSCTTLGTGMVSLRDLLPPLAWITPGDLGIWDMSQAFRFSVNQIPSVKRNQET